MKNYRTAVFLCHYRRPEYTEKCLKALSEAQEYPNADFFVVEDDNPNLGLRNRIIDFFEYVKDKDYDLLTKIDNDCIYPKNWLNIIEDKFRTTNIDILSPNVVPSNAALKFGKDDKENLGYRPAEIVGGLWTMKSSLIKDMDFEKHDIGGLIGAISLLKQICVEKDPKIGWITEVTVEDIGHWSGQHPEHIKSVEHEIYSKEVGRQIAWSGK